MSYKISSVYFLCWWLQEIIERFLTQGAMFDSLKKQSEDNAERIETLKKNKVRQMLFTLMYIRYQAYSGSLHLQVHVLCHKPCCIICFRFSGCVPVKCQHAQQCTSSAMWPSIFKKKQQKHLLSVFLWKVQLDLSEEFHMYITWFLRGAARNTRHVVWCKDVSPRDELLSMAYM